MLIFILPPAFFSPHHRGFVHAGRTGPPLIVYFPSAWSEQRLDTWDEARPPWIDRGLSVHIKSWAQFGHIWKIVLLETRPCVGAKDRKSSGSSSEIPCASREKDSLGAFLNPPQFRSWLGDFHGCFEERGIRTGASDLASAPLTT